MADFIPKKSLGQNFLVDQNVQQKIIASCDLSPEDIVLEIGPGKGALTYLLAPRVKRVIAIEKDRSLALELQERFASSQVTIIHADILKYAFEKLPEPVKVVGNLPYNIATPIIQKVLEHKHKFFAFYMTVQLEYGQRLVARVSTKSYGALSCLVQYHAQTRMLFRIGRAAFKPVPKVQSCFLSFQFPDENIIKVENEKLFFDIIRKAFQQRRKTIVNALAGAYPKAELTFILERLGMNPKLRAENLSLEDYSRLTKAIANHPIP